MILAAKIKRFLFRRGTLPMGDFHELRGRLRDRGDEWQAPLRRLGPAPVATILGGEPSEEAAAKYEARRKAAYNDSAELFLRIFEGEAEAQWDRIIDRRAKDLFYSVIVSGLLGYLLGKLT